MGLEPTTLRLRVSCSTDWANRATLSSAPHILGLIRIRFVLPLRRSLLQTNSELTAAIIDALSNLNIATDLAAEVRTQYNNSNTLCFMQIGCRYCGL